MVKGKDGRIVEDRALGIYPISVYAHVHLYMTSLAAVLVLTINIKTLVIK